ncbi:MAG: response regulator [Myxococcota bacterium]|nr:response regulator [Myxococcota bacterium]
MSSDEKHPLGKILLQRRLVSQQELDDGLRAQKRAASRVPIASQLIDEGKIDELEALRALSEQHGVPGIDLAQIAIVLDHLDVVPREVAETHRILPVLARPDRIFLAMADPRDRHVIDELEFVTGKKVFPYLALHTRLLRATAAAYDAKDRGERHYLGPNVPAETLRQLGLVSQASSATTVASPPAANAATAVPPSLHPRPSSIASQRPPAVEPPAPPPVIEQAFERSSRSSEVSTSEFGLVDPDLSSVTMLPAELQASASHAANEIEAGEGKLILIVDDEAEIRVLLKRVLVQLGYRVLEADRGILALRLVKDHVPDLIILDAMLPELHGFDIARRIKGSAKYGRIPIIMVSAVYRGWRIAADLKQNYGVEEYIEKPFRMADVTDAVQRLLSPAGNASAGTRDADHLSADAEDALNHGIAAYKAGDIDAAIEHLKRGILVDPLSYRLHFHVALLYGKKGLIYDGIQELERAIDLNPRHFAALKNLAVLYEKAGFKNKAVEMWERCAASAPDDAARAPIREHLLGLI